MATRPIVISIQGDDSNLKKALRNASDNVKGFGKTVAKIGTQAGVAFAATAGAVGVKAISSFADFEKSMNEVMTLLPDAGEGAFDELSGQVKDFSKQFGVLPATSFRPSIKLSQPGYRATTSSNSWKPPSRRPKAGSPIWRRPSMASLPS